jgi:hypothetical protein
VSDPLRRVAAASAAIAVLALVACDLWVGTVRIWWDRHSLTGSVVSNLLVLAVAALIVDEVVARRQRRERAISVAVQGLIVYGQARRAYDAVSATGVESGPESGAPDELRALASMLLTASPNLFDDPEARRFLEQVERLSVSMLQRVVGSSRVVANAGDPQRMESDMARVKKTVDPLLARIPAEDRGWLEGTPHA